MNGASAEKLAEWLTKNPRLCLFLARCVNSTAWGVGAVRYWLPRTTHAMAVPAQPMDTAALRQKRDCYVSLGSDVADSDGFIEWEKCDSLLFSGLYGTPNLLAARDAAGMWHRRSLQHPECYCAGSASTISRDMLVGVLWWIWTNKRLDVAEELFSYGRSNSWIMGQGDVSRIYFTPALQATLAEIIFRLGGPNHRAYRGMPQIHASNVGFAAHLDVLVILLRGEMLGRIPAASFNILASHFNRNPRNPLFCYAFHRFYDGDHDDTTAALMDEAIFPNNRLPTNADRAEPWINQRDPGPDWEPETGAVKIHSGGDFVFVANLLLGR